MNQLSKILDETLTSSNPRRRERAIGHIRRMMREPLRANEASKKLMKHTDDQKLHADILHFSKQDPHIDVRPVVKSRMRQLKVQGF